MNVLLLLLLAIQYRNKLARATPQRLVGNAAPTGNLQHAYELLVKLAGQRRDAKHCDVLLQVENTAKVTGELGSEARGVWAHRAVLAASSPYFYGMFYNNVQELTTVVVIKDVKLETLRALVDNVYTASCLSVSVETAVALLAAATMLEVDEVRVAACECLKRALSADNALSIRASAIKHGCTALAAAATEYIHRHLEHVVAADESPALKPPAMAFLQDRYDHLASKESVSTAILRATQHHPQDWQLHLDSMLNVVPAVPREELVSRKALELQPQEQLKLRDTPESLGSQDVTLTQPDSNRQHSYKPRDMLEGLKPQLRKPRDAVKPLEQQKAVDDSILVTTTDCELIVTPSPTADRAKGPYALLVIGGYSRESALVCPLPNGQWQPAAAMPTPRSAAGAALLDDRVYVVGGLDGYITERSVLVYDVGTDSWATGPPMKTARSYLGVAALGGRLYAAGGREKSIEFKKVEVLDPREGVWRTVANMGSRRNEHALVALDGRLYAIGGHEWNTALKSTERFDPIANKWEDVEDMEERRAGLGVGVVDDSIYALGGWDNHSLLKSMERYRVGRGWEPAPPLPTSRRNAAVTTRGGRMYVLGGDDSSHNMSTVLMFDTVTDQWKWMPHLPEVRRAPAAVVITSPLQKETQQQKALLVMGCTHKDNFAFTMIRPLTSGHWKYAAVLPENRRLFSASFLNDRVYVAGGLNGSSPTRTVFVYDVKTNKWSTGPPMKVDRCGPGMATLRGRLYVAGGSNDDVLHSVEAMDPREGVWRRVASMTSHREGHGVTTLGGKLYAVGGSDGHSVLNSTERYDLRADRWKPVADMTNRRWGVGVAVAGGAIYAVGGSNRASDLQSVERYTEQSGWKFAPPMDVSRRYAAVTNYEDRLYVAGGTHGNDIRHTSVSMFDPATDTWSKLSELPHGFWSPTAVIVPWTPHPVAHKSPRKYCTIT